MLMITLMFDKYFIGVRATKTRLILFVDYLIIQRKILWSRILQNLVDLGIQGPNPTPNLFLHLLLFLLGKIHYLRSRAKLYALT